MSGELREDRSMLLWKGKQFWKYQKMSSYNLLSRRYEKKCCHLDAYLQLGYQKSRKVSIIFGVVTLRGRV
jgi:hypothetical protein